MLEEALAARVIEELTGAVDRYHFTHALIQDTLADELSATRRVRLHGRIGEALERLYGEAADQHAAELAHHFGQAQTLLGPDKFVQYSRVAGEAPSPPPHTSRRSPISTARSPRRMATTTTKRPAVFRAGTSAAGRAAEVRARAGVKQLASCLRLLRTGR